MDTPETFAPRLFITAPPVSLVSAAAYRAIIQDKDTVQYTLRATLSKEATARAASTGQLDTTGLPLEYHDFADVFSEQEAYNLPPHRESRENLGDVVKYYNSVIYGQPNPWYTPYPSICVGPDCYRQLSIPEKFTPFFDHELQESYEHLLGPLAKQTPATSDALKVLWEDVLRWIVQSKLSGFSTGLAPSSLQTI
jgi:hypothetical protein